MKVRIIFMFPAGAIVLSPEVEAALDDANLRRFLRLVELLRSSAQVIIVTHQQQTMESGDTLYGITMEPGGSSQVVAKRLTDLSV